jgi:anti-sigma-K factor RskA
VGVHEQLGDQAAAYVLGALTPAERQVFEAHLATCVVCAAEVRRLAFVGAALAQTAPVAEPAPAVRDRLLSSIATASPPQAGAGGGWMAVAASVALAVALGGYSLQLRGRVTTLESRLRDATLRAEAGERQMADVRRTAADAQSSLLVLAAPDLARIDLAGQPAAPNATARAFWSRSRGLVFTASNLPPPPPGRAYQLWVLTAQPAPISAGMLTLDANGRVNARFDTPLDLPRPVAMAVTLEPEGGVPSPTGDKYLVGPAI